MKVANVIPIFKNGSKTELDNYRPISLLYQFSKILEKLYNKWLEEFIDKNDILSNSQYGFWSLMSTSYALLDLVKEMSTSLDKTIYTWRFCGLKESIWHCKSVNINTKKHGILGVAEKWVETYLSNRSQFVKIDDCSSNLLNVSCGVPQGSVLGPKLFILYINDICNVSELLKFVLFADDANILCSDTDVHRLTHVVNCELVNYLVHC